MVAHTVSKEELVFSENDVTTFSKQSNKWKLFVAAFAILLILLVLFVALFAVEKKRANELTENGSMSGKQKHASTKRPIIATTKKQAPKSTLKPSSKITADKVKVSAGMLNRMDLKANPCNDFYQYSCGNWVDKTPIPDSKTKYSTFSQLSTRNREIIKLEMNKIALKTKNISSLAIQNAVKFYQACMNKKVIEKRYDQPLKDLIKKYNSWPVTNSSFDATSWNWTDTFTRFHKYLSLAPIFNMYVGDDIKNSTQNAIIFSQSGLGIQREAYLVNSTFHTKYSQAYRKLMKTIVTLLGANETGTNIMDQVYEFEKKLANITLPVAVARQYNTLYTKLSLKDFANQTEIPLAWLKGWLNSAFRESNFVAKDSDMVITYAKDYIKNAYKLFHQESKSVQSAYIMWKGVHSMAGTLLGKYKAAYNDFVSTVFGTSDEDPRWEKCMSSTSSSFGFALGRLFVDTTFQTSAKTMADEMITAIRNVFIENIDTLDWMDGVTKVAAKEKARAIIENIGYPSFIKNDTQLDKYYAGLIVQSNKYFENILSRRSFYNLRNYAKVGKPVDKTEWGMVPAQVNAYYSPTENKIVFPAGILQSPFYDFRAPRAVNYGAIGVVVGHEITHGFDDQGKNFNKDGNSFNWWTKKSEQGFKKNSECLINQYSKYTMYGKNLNGNQTLGENIADNGGLKAAFKAYRKWVQKFSEETTLPGLDLTPEQLFFVGFAQVWCSKYRESGAIQQIETGVHTVSKYRVIGTLHNSKEFAEVFKCPQQSYMNAPTKCSVW
eukprot:gene15175-16734_t